MIPDQDAFNVAAGSRLGRRFLRRKLVAVRKLHERCLATRETLRAATVDNERNFYDSAEWIRRIEAALGETAA